MTTGTGRSTASARLIRAAPHDIYRAFLDPAAVAAWLPPGDMIGAVHGFEPCESGAFSMSLSYPDSAPPRGKTSARTDTFAGRFVKLVPDTQIVWAVRFESADPAFAGEMIVTTTLAPVGAATRVTMACDNIPVGIRPEDNEAGTRLSLEQLARFVEARERR